MFSFYLYENICSTNKINGEIGDKFYFRNNIYFNSKFYRDIF